jgi:RNA polymerase sigma-70 factor (ECF subfamily)
MPRPVACSPSPGLLKKVTGVLALGGVPWDELADGVQEVRARLLAAQADRNRPEIQNPGAWAAVVASRVAADWHRAQGRETRLRDRLAARWRARPPADGDEDDRVQALAVARGLDELPAPQRQLIVLRFHLDLTIPQIARELDVPEGTVKSRLHTALAALRRHLADLEVIEE